MQTMMKEKQLAVVIAGIGDLVMASKSLRAMKRFHHDRELWLLTSSEAAALAAYYPYIDRVIPFPIREFRKNRGQGFTMWQTLIRLRQIHFMQCTNLYLVGSRLGALKMGLLFTLLHGKIKAGHDAFGFGAFLTVKAPTDIFTRRHFVDAMGDIAALSGATPDDGGLDVFWDHRFEQKWQPFFDKHHDNILIGINPGGDRPNRRWGTDRFASVADALSHNDKAMIVLFGGPGEEALADTIGKHLPAAKVVSVAGRLNLHELCYLISRLDLFITNDSGPMHIAAATGTPVVAIFGPENPRFLRPYAPEGLYRVVYKDVPCRPCNKSACDNPICLTSITTDEVLSSARDLLRTAVFKIADPTKPVAPPTDREEDL
ncbi:MAG: hypothetical protein CSYNP_01127 [Syntrophus sp. SKADARSKE-3]|nr:hypothetical protein [Syntrophus sp. SKADARSKE-3]